MYINTDNIYDKWSESKRYTDQLTEPFPEFQRIARNEPYADSDPNYPNVTDGTTASIIKKTPKRVVQQIPTGVITSEDGEDWLDILAEFVLLNKIIPYANEDYGLFEKSQLIIENGLTFGSGVSYTPFTNHNGYYCPDMRIIYWGDIYLQPGKVSGEACQYIFIRSWWQPEDVTELIDSEKKLSEQAKARGEKYKSTWDLSALEELKDHKTVKDQQATTPSENERVTDNSAIEIVTAFQTGKDNNFYTFSPSAKLVIRTKVNKDPRGKIPLDWFYGDIDGTNPLGRSMIELVGPLQNLIDSDMQAYQYNRALALQPPVVKYGNIGNFKYEPNAVLDARDDPNAKIIPLTIDTQALTNYPQLYGLQKSQLLNLFASPDTSISADVGNPGFSKTPTGINQQKANISVDDNAVRKRFETWFGNWCETAVNLYFGERTGTEILKLDKETADRLRKLASKGRFDESLLNENDEVIIDYDQATPELKFTVDASTSRMADDQTQMQANDLLIKAIDSSPVLQTAVPPEKVLSLWNSLVALSGVENPEELVIDIDEYKEQQAMAEQQQAMTAMPPETPPEAPEQAPQLDPDDQDLIAELKALSVPDEVIQQVIVDLDNGMTDEEIKAKYFGGGNAE